MKKSKSRVFFAVLRVICVIICIASFIANGFENFAEFAAQKKTQVTEVVAQPRGLNLPSFTFCAESGYKTVGIFANLTQYLEQTFEAEELFDGFYYSGAESEAVSSILKPIYTSFRGRCYTYRHPKKVQWNPLNITTLGQGKRLIITSGMYYQVLLFSV